MGDIIRFKNEIHKNQEKHQKLDAQFHEVARNDTQGHNQAREIYFSEYSSIILEYGRSFGEAIGEIVPRDDAAHIKQWLWQSIRADTCQVTEYEGKGNRRKQGLDKEPQRAKDSLLIKRNKIPAHQQPKEIPVAPYILEVKRKNGGLWFDDQIPVVREMFGFHDRLLDKAFRGGTIQKVILDYMPILNQKCNFINELNF